MGWLRKILDVSRFQKLRDEKIRSSLNQEKTLCKRIQQRRLTWFGQLERMKDKRILTQSVTLLYIGNRSRGRQRQTRMDNVKDTNA